MKELWRPVVGFEGYYLASNLGRIKSLSRYIKHWRGGLALLPERILQSKRAKGRPVVILCRNGVLQHKTVYRIVAEAWIPNPKNKPEIHHKDGDINNNAIFNLQWMNRKEHVKVTVALGQYKSKTKGTKLDLSTGMVIRKRLLNGEMGRLLAKEYQVSEGLISMIRHNRCWYRSEV